VLENQSINSVSKEENCTCYKCGHTYKKDKIKKFKIHDRNETSYFYYTDADIYLCEECQTLIDTDWFNNEEMLHQDSTYNCEEELQDFINNFPLEYQEKVYNQGFPSEYRVDSKDWIKDQIKLDKILKRKEWSDSEIEQYISYYENT